MSDLRDGPRHGITRSGLVRRGPGRRASSRRAVQRRRPHRGDHPRRDVRPLHLPQLSVQRLDPRGTAFVPPTSGAATSSTPRSTAASSTGRCSPTAPCGRSRSAAAWRGVTLRGANLTGQDLSGVDLREADLSMADLTAAVLRDAKLDGATLREADLTKADLRGACSAASTCGGDPQAPGSTWPAPSAGRALRRGRRALRGRRAVLDARRRPAARRDLHLEPPPARRAVPRRLQHQPLPAAAWSPSASGRPHCPQNSSTTGSSRVP